MKTEYGLLNVPSFQAVSVKVKPKIRHSITSEKPLPSAWRYGPKKEGEIAKGTLRSLIRSAGLTVDEFSAAK